MKTIIINKNSSLSLRSLSQGDKVGVNSVKETNRSIHKDLWTLRMSSRTISTGNNSDTKKVFALGSVALTLFYLRSIGYIIPWSFGKISSMRGRYNSAMGFYRGILKLNREKSATHVVKQLKAYHIALMRYVAGQPFKNLREVEPDLPLKGLIRGVPSIIDPHSRHLIRKGHIETIRFGLSLFNLYRVLKCPFNPKLSTITDGYKGSNEVMMELLTRAYQWTPFNQIKAKTNLQKKDLVPSYPEIIQSASPSSNPSGTGLLTDALGLEYHGMGEKIEQYLGVIESNLPKKRDMTLDGREDISIFRRYYREALRLGIETEMIMNRGMTNKGTRGSRPAVTCEPQEWVECGENGVRPIGQICAKEEAAGKLRLFAIVDTWTQSLFKPLHKYLFQILEQIPNDGTLNQDACVRRAQEKALQAKKVYSFDLSAATDRLPIRLQSQILDSVTGIPGIGVIGASILVDREYVIPSSYKKKYGIEEILVKYQTGQPMGAYSSGAMLAITHHGIMQYCAGKVYRGNPVKTFIDLSLGYGNTDYEILGDDIVIFDERLALEYYKLMSELGVEINLSKSLVSSKGCFEFAKRFIYMGVDATGMSGKQLVDYHQFSGAKSMSLIQGFERRFIGSFYTLEALHRRELIPLWLSNRGMKKIMSERKSLSTLITMLGILAKQGRMPLSWLASTLVKPSVKMEGSWNQLLKEGIPFRRVFKYIKEICWQLPAMKNTPDILEMQEYGSSDDAVQGIDWLKSRLEIMETYCPIPKKGGDIRGSTISTFYPYWAIIESQKRVEELGPTKKISLWGITSVGLRDRDQKDLEQIIGEDSILKVLRAEGPNWDELQDKYPGHLDEIRQFFVSTIFKDCTMIGIQRVLGNPEKLTLEKVYSTIKDLLPHTGYYTSGPDGDRMNYGDSAPIQTLDMIGTGRDPTLGRLDLQRRQQGRPYERRPTWLITLIEIMNGDIPGYDQVSRARRMFSHRMIKGGTTEDTLRSIAELRKEEQIDQIVDNKPNFILVDYREPVKEEKKGTISDNFDEMIKLYEENPTKAYKYALEMGLLQRRGRSSS